MGTSLFLSASYHRCRRFTIPKQKILRKLSEKRLEIWFSKRKLNKIKPIDESVVEYLKNCDTVYFYEESVKSGSVGEIFASLLIENNINVHFKHIAIDDEFVKQASVCRQLEHYNLDTNSIIKEVNNG